MSNPMSVRSDGLRNKISTLQAKATAAKATIDKAQLATFW